MLQSRQSNPNSRASSFATLEPHQGIVPKYFSIGWRVNKTYKTCAGNCAHRSVMEHNVTGYSTSMVEKFHENDNNPQPKMFIDSTFTHPQDIGLHLRK